MNRIMKWSMTLLAGLLLWPAAGSAQSADDIAFDKEIDPNSMFPVVNSHKYPNTMTITAQVIINDKTLGTDAIVAVYAGDEIRGKERPVNDKEKLVYLTVYGSSSTMLTFKVWLDGIVYKCRTTLTFENESNAGSPIAPFIIDFIQKKGDVNRDSNVDVADIVEVTNYIKKTPSENFNMDAADVDNNGVVDNKDIEGIVEIIMGGDSTQ